ncbi:hypothetical protein ACHQM5_017680 [Ranunculus cassubicifolius]
MSQEKIQMCSNGSSGGGRSSSSKKIKQNKVPQRGLGVEKLERIRLEEQRKNGSVPAAAAASSGPVAVMHAARDQYQYELTPSVSIQPPSIPFSSSSPFSEFSSMSSNNNLLGLGLHQTPKHFKQNTDHTTGMSSVAAPAFAWPVDGTGSGLNSESRKMENGFLNGSSFHLQNGLKPNWPPFVQTQWSQHNQQLSSLVEPPSNQTTYSNYSQSNYSNYMSSLRHEGKMVGMKRSWPFSLDNLQDSSSFPHNITSLEAYGNSMSNVREGPSGSNSNTFSWMEKNLELRPNRRSKDDLILDGDFLNTNKRIKGNGTLDGDFLSLGLSTTTTCSSTIKFKQSFTFPPPDYQELSKIDVLAFQGSIEDQVNHSIGFIQQQYSFFPSDERHIAQSTSSKGEVGESVDLTLKL